MSLHERKERERAQRHRLIVSTARELAEAQGWEAVTTRRLAERIEYSQPVLYSHFRNREEIVGAVAMEGFTELSAALRAAEPDDRSARAAVLAVARAYTDFATANPALYDAMFRLDNGLPFADEATPAPLHESFQALLAPLARNSGPHDAGLLTETFWAALHGLATLTRSGRIPEHQLPERLDILADRYTPHTTAKPPTAP